MKDKLKVGVLFGGPSREREISFAGGRTVYDNLNKDLFEVIPLFLDSRGNLIVLDWHYVYKGTIRDFYPPVSYLPPSPNGFQIYVESLHSISHEEEDQMIKCIGKKIRWADLKETVDFIFLCLHGQFGEDGQVQGILDSLLIPYSGSGVQPSAIGMDKSFQKKLMEQAQFASPKMYVWGREILDMRNFSELYKQVEKQIGFPCVIRPAHQGSSIGVTVLSADALQSDFKKAVETAFFIQRLDVATFRSLIAEDQINLLRSVCDLRDGIGLPMKTNGIELHHPEELLQTILNTEEKELLLEGIYSENKIIVESFIKGREFSCIVIRMEDGSAFALPPTEIIKRTEMYDYRSKYLPGLSRKQTPIEVKDSVLDDIRKECVRLFNYFEFHTYARIDGFLGEDGLIYLNDPNTTSGMMPSSFFFHQAAEIGLNPSQFLSYIIRISLQERIHTQLQISQFENLLRRLDENLQNQAIEDEQKKKVAVILGGYSYERHISVESGRNIYEKLASSEKYHPFPVFLTGDASSYQLYKIPINFMLKDNADDIKEKIEHFHIHPYLKNLRHEAQSITAKYSSASYHYEPQLLSFEDLKKEADIVFIALHGRPGEDGNIQKRLEEISVPYNGSNPQSAALTIHKYNTLQRLKSEGFIVAQQLLLTAKDYNNQQENFISRIESEFHYPFIAKPVDDGCSSAVVKIKNRDHLNSYLEALFRANAHLTDELRNNLQLDANEEFPQKSEVLIEEMITSNNAKQFLEITGGLLTHIVDNKIRYEIFEASETLTSGEVLSLEEKFLAGEGQNITPPRFGKNKSEYEIISAKVKAALLKAAITLDVTGYARIDAFVRIYDDNNVETIIIEVNSLPGMTPATCIFHQCAVNGYTPYEFIDQILEFGTHDKSK